MQLCIFVLEGQGVGVKTRSSISLLEVFLLFRDRHHYCHCKATVSQGKGPILVFSNRRPEEILARH